MHIIEFLFLFVRIIGPNNFRVLNVSSDASIKMTLNIDIYFLSSLYLSFSLLWKFLELSMAWVLEKFPSSRIWNSYMMSNIIYQNIHSYIEVFLKQSFLMGRLFDLE
jgi:hypothetical protein